MLFWNLSNAKSDFVKSSDPTQDGWLCLHPLVNLLFHRHLIWFPPPYAIRIWSASLHPSLFEQIFLNAFIRRRTMSHWFAIDRTVNFYKDHKNFISHLITVKWRLHGSDEWSKLWLTTVFVFEITIASDLFKWDYYTFSLKQIIYHLFFKKDYLIFEWNYLIF